MRALNPIEHSFTCIDAFYPFIAVCVLKVKGGPEVDILKSSLNRLHKIHPLLNAVIKKGNNRYWFEKEEELKSIPLNVISRKDRNHWEDVVRQDLNKGFNINICPLMRVTYLVSPTLSEEAEIVMSFHHAIVDAEVIMLIADQLLSFASQDQLGENTPEEFLSIQVSPELRKVLPLRFKGINFILKLMPFIYRQLKDEVQYQKANKAIPDASIPFSSENDIFNLSFSKEETISLIKLSRKNKVTLSSILSAAMLIIINEQNYEGRKKLLRYLQFRNLRPYLHPSLRNGEDGCFVAMLRYTVPIAPESSILKIAASIDQQALVYAKRGDKFIFALISKFLVKKTIKAQNARLGSTALSYLGPVMIKQQYGSIRVTGINGYITNNCLGAELTGFAKIFSEQLSVDLNFLTAETSRGKALEIAKKFRQIILTSIDT